MPLWYSLPLAAPRTLGWSVRPLDVPISQPANGLIPVGEQRLLVRLFVVRWARMPTYTREAAEDHTGNHEDRRDERHALDEHKLVSCPLGHRNNARRLDWVQRCAQGAAAIWGARPSRGSLPTASSAVTGSTR